MEPFPANHEPDTCTDAWLASLSSCIDAACPPTAAVDNEDYNSDSALLQLAPKMTFPCEQSVLPGDANDDTGVSLPLTEGNCVTSPYPFQSFIGSSNGSDQNEYTLEVFSTKACAGQAQNLSVATGDFAGGACRFMPGQSVRLTLDQTSTNMSANAGESAGLVHASKDPNVPSCSCLHRCLVLSIKPWRLCRSIELYRLVSLHFNHDRWGYVEDYTIFQLR